MFEDKYAPSGCEVPQQAMQLSNQRQTRRQQLQNQRVRIAASLASVDKAIAALDAHPDLEEFIEILSNAGC